MTAIGTVAGLVVALASAVESGEGSFDVLADAVRAGDLAKVSAAVGEQPGLVSAHDAEGRSLLHHAATAGQTALITLLLDKGADINSATQDVATWGPGPGTDRGLTPLIAAARAHQWEAVKLLIEKGAEVKAATLWGGTALGAAVGGRHMPTVELLLAKGAEVNAQERDGILPLAGAAYGGSTDIVKLLLEKGANPNGRRDNGWTPLHMAAHKGGKTHLEVIRLLLANGANVDAVAADGATPFVAAARNGHLEAARLLLEKGANAHLVCQDGLTAALWAAKGFEGGTAGPMIDYLVENKLAGLDERTWNGRTILHLAAQHNSATVKYALGKGLDVNARTITGYTPLHFAAARNDGKSLSLLLEAQADVDAATDNGCTPLHVAASGAELNFTTGTLLLPENAKNPRGQLAIAKLLLERGADPNKLARFCWLSNDGWTPLHLAAQIGDTEMIVLLLANKADIEAKSQNLRSTPLHVAAQHGQTAAVKLLLERGASTQAKDRQGKTAWDLAAEAGMKETAAALKN
jgi:cytohesin